MRNIKFRGMTSKGWLYGGLIHNRDKVYIAPIGEIYHESVPEDFEVDENSISQFTGLCDKNNKEIYEGDKLKYSFELFKEFIPGSVIFNRGSFDFLGYPLRTFQTNQYEIIGNIYDNKDSLVKEEKERKDTNEYANAKSWHEIFIADAEQFSRKLKEKELKNNNNHEA